MENGQQPASKQDLEVLRGEMHQDLEMFRGEMRHMSGHLTESMRDVQTVMVKAFYSYAQTTDLKLKNNEASDVFLRQRLTVVESRLTEVERRLNMPPNAS